MERPVAQLLQQAIAAHQEGKLQDAERLYRSILQSQPDHAGVNHNLGLLAVSAGKINEALPLFENALRAKPNLDQFCLSYIDALIMAKQSDRAKQVLEKARLKGIAEQKLRALEHRLEAMAKTRNFSSERITEKQTPIKVANDNDPPRQKLVRLLEHYQEGRFRDAEELARRISQEFPSHKFSWKILGAVLQETGRHSEALDANQTAVTISPQDAEAYNNLGASLEALGHLDLAKNAYRQAILLKPDYAEAYTNLGSTFYELGELNESIGSYTDALDVQSTSAETYALFGRAIANAKFNSSNPKLYTPLKNLLTNHNSTRPSEAAPAILSLLSHDPKIKDLLLEENFPTSFSDVIYVVRTLHGFPLLHQLMRLCPLPSVQFEKLFVSIRGLLLNNLNKLKVSPELTHFLSTLSIHCFTNEHVFFESDEETQLVCELEAQIRQSLAASRQPAPLQILCFATYRRLHQHSWCKKLKSLDNLEEVKRRLIDEPFCERDVAEDIASLEELSDAVSLKVREQYEENPYPRWVKPTFCLMPVSIAAVTQAFKLKLYSEGIKAVTTPSILVAGCGTGQHSIDAACRYLNCHVIAVDLSLSSLAYAQRKTDELGLDNLEYLQADILHLYRIDKEFDIIESGGVLHHMKEPMAGWRVLVNLLKSGGLMRIGLYSEFARRHIVAVRKEINLLGVGASESAIRKFRQSLLESNNEDHRRLTESNDFYSLSMLRDLIFHVQEHRFTIPQIASCLDELGLKFCGFEGEDTNKQFEVFHGEAADPYDLTQWHQFEESNPDTFFGMYNFWCQKP